MARVGQGHRLATSNGHTVDQVATELGSARDGSGARPGSLLPFPTKKLDPAHEPVPWDLYALRKRCDAE
ncbi:MAG: hypothetical protein M0029_00585 [Actinomycetota bacterium]|jgi:hypothetical protein|nr:hypothetical protein [Actinomycetota bacterium]